MKVAGRQNLRDSVRTLFVLLLMGCPVAVQAAPQTPQAPLQGDTDARIAALDKSLQETRAELTQTREEIRQLRTLLEAMNKRMAAANSFSPSQNMPEAPAQNSAGAATSGSSAAPPAQISEDDWQILKAEVEQQAQEKVESGSKYRLKLSGLLLLNAFDVNGQVDDLDVPTVALPRSPGSAPGSLGASLRQSIFGITGTGPDLLGARTSADLQMDFFGGLPSGYGGGTTSGVVRLRLARIRFDWKNSSVIAGLDTPFFSPEMPTSYMSIAIPAFASSGNLWTWSPTVRVERRFDTNFSQFKIEAGFLAPPAYTATFSSIRFPTPGENSRQPVYAVRFSANGTHGDRPPAIGVSGIYFPQRFANDVTVSGWGSMVDWRFPLLPHTELSGEFFAGKGLDAFGGVPIPRVPSQDYSEYLAGASALAQIPMMGGWSQLKVFVDARNEFNVAVGTGGRDSADLTQDVALFPGLQYVSPRNQTLFVNYIFRPRSDLLLSPEFRRIRTYPLAAPSVSASQIGLAAGFIF